MNRSRQLSADGRDTVRVVLPLFLAMVLSATGAFAEPEEENGGAPLGCWILGSDTGWNDGRKGDLLCLEKDRIVLLGDGSSDTWAVQWTGSEGTWKAHTIGTPFLEKHDIHWLTGRDGKGHWFQRRGGQKIRLARPSEARSAVAAERLRKVACPLHYCRETRKCLEAAMPFSPELRALADPRAIYGLTACTGYRSIARQSLRDVGQRIPESCK
jgi:hypothetical protein